MASAEADAWIEAALAGVGRTVLVGIVGIRGSSPREVGARMAVGRDTLAGSIGGGMLEHMAVRRARTLLDRDADRPCLISFPLGPDTQQCCGGVVTLFFEPVTAAVADVLAGLPAQLDEGAVIATRLDGDAKRVAAVGRWAGEANDARLVARGAGGLWLEERLRRRRFPVALFGAGHVGQALVRALGPLPFRVQWFDSRAEMFPTGLPPAVSAETVEDPAAAVASLPPGAAVIVMTHSHPIDFQICCAALTRDDLCYVGLIGSATKRNRFTAQMRRDGLGDDAISRLVCPIGIPGIGGKGPAVIAASVAAELLRVAEQRRSPATGAQGISEREADSTPVAEVF